jgi:hypothetical protein
VPPEQELQLLKDPQSNLLLQKVAMYALGKKPVQVACVVCNENGLELMQMVATHAGFEGLHCVPHAHTFHESVAPKHNCCELNYHPNNTYPWRVQLPVVQVKPVPGQE